MSVIVANAMVHDCDVSAGASALEAELGTDDEVIWVDRAGLGPPRQLSVRHSVKAHRTAGRGHCYGLGLEASRKDLVAFTDSTTVVAAGWRHAAGEALEAGAIVVGGPVVPSVPRSARGWAGFLAEYGPHAAPPHTSSTGDVAANNVGYQRSAWCCGGWDGRVPATRCWSAGWSGRCRP